tara:strand:- start:3711 stop:4181 length:471 start_codon:yes stop_codon:yes gene_type:complete
MALLQDILQQVQDMGFGSQSYMNLANLSPEQISTTLRSYYGLGGEDLPAHLFQGISSDILTSGLASTYSPQIEASGASMLGKLQETIGGGKGIQAAGGFAGSGQQQQYVQSAKDVYGKGMSDVLAQTGQQRLAGLQNVQNIMNQWRDTALRIKGTI